MNLPEDLQHGLDDAGAKLRTRYPPWLRPFLARDVIGITLGRRIYLSPRVEALPSDQAERLIRHGTALIASIAFGPGELDGAPLTSSPGHLLVIRGFTRHGRVIVNDPAADHARGVRRVYKRGQFENAWLPTTGGTVYILRRGR